MLNERVIIGDIPIDAIDLPTATAYVDDFVQARIPRQIVTVNLDFLAIARRHSIFRQVLQTADLSLADGQPIVWLSRRGPTPLPERVTGVDLLGSSCQLAAERGYRPFLLGAAPGVAEAAATVLEQRFPGLRVAGVHCPPFGDESAREARAAVSAVRRARPDLLFVALGAPRQDLWIREHLNELEVPVCMGVGGAFNFVAGMLPRAPRWMQRAGMEWLFRLGQEPGRLWRRYLLNDLPLMLHLLLDGESGAAATRLQPSRPAIEPVVPVHAGEPARMAGVSD
jgi:N-acetylglucosaminyldiphosphoundecaprenol N-acetyl-beta-D-mannosaminyltransferase